MKMGLNNEFLDNLGRVSRADDSKLTYMLFSLQEIRFTQRDR